jgi:hypothetical protein
MASAQFNGSNCFQTSNTGQFSPDNFTVAFWIKPVSRGTIQSITTCRDGSTLRGWMIYISASNNLEFVTGNGGATWNYGTEDLYNNITAANTFVHIAFALTKATNTTVVYINGTLKATITRTYTNNTTHLLRIGAGADGTTPELFVGSGTLMDDFRIYNRVLSASEISAVYTGVGQDTINNEVKLTDIGVGSFSGTTPAIEHVTMNLETVNLPTFS